MKCPVCKTNRCVPIKLAEDLKASACESCGGHWISRQNYAAWLESHGDTLPEKPFTEIEFDVNDVKEAKLCPDCGNILLKYKVGHGLDFFVDHCPGCGGVWLDNNEWNALQDKNLHDEIHKIFSTAWQNQIRGDQMRATLEKVYSNRLGAEAYGRTKDFRQWLHNHPQRQAILAFLSDNAPYEV